MYSYVHWNDYDANNNIIKIINRNLLYRLNVTLYFFIETYKNVVESG
jgi:hypothetical protein